MEWIIPIVIFVLVAWAMFKGHAEVKIIMLCVLCIVGVLSIKSLFYFTAVQTIPEKKICDVLYDSGNQFGENRWVLVKAEGEESSPHFSLIGFDSLARGIRQFIKVDDRFYPVISPAETAQISSSQ